VNNRKRDRPFIRTLLGDLPADVALGTCDAHEHVAMLGPRLSAHFPEFILEDAERLLVDLREFHNAGGGWIVDSMPTRAGRDARLLAELSRTSCTPIVCPTGVHQAKYYLPDDPILALDRDRLSRLFIREIVECLDDGDGPLELRAGVIKVASGGDTLTRIERERFAAAAIAQRETGCPILTHTAGGHDAFEQVVCLRKHGANLAHVVLSHCDKTVDAAYHRELLQSGVCLEYDQHFRQLARGERCATVDLLASLVKDFPHQLLVGMDMARQRYRTGYGGTPGMGWLVTGLRPRLRDAGLTDEQLARIFVENPLNAFAFLGANQEQLTDG
jgi:predicted metal-dependent phosphotriesterase family hydrolase